MFEYTTKPIMRTESPRPSVRVPMAALLMALAVSGHIAWSAAQRAGASLRVGA